MRYLDDVVATALHIHLSSGGESPFTAEFYKANRAAITASMRKHGIIGRLMTLDRSQPKIHKSIGRGVQTAILHLAPGSLSGFETCRWRTAECFPACLFSSGQGSIGREGHVATLTESRRGQVAQARIRRTRWFGLDPILALARLAHELWLLIKRADRNGLLPAARLNGTSDLCWEVLGVVQAFPLLSFYDYTKGTGRLEATPENYRLTLSYSGHNAAACQAALDRGHQVAVVVYGEGDPKKAAMPGKLWGHRAVDADAHDYRPADGPGVMALRPKGRFIRESVFTARVDRMCATALDEAREASALLQIR